jgi:hypothetical protein
MSSGEMTMETLGTRLAAIKVTTGVIEARSVSAEVSYSKMYSRPLNRMARLEEWIL